MRWPDYRKLHPDAWVIVEIVSTSAGARESGAPHGSRSLERIAVIETCADAETTYRRYRELRRAHPLAHRELCFLNTAWSGREIEERWQFSRDLHDTVVDAAVTL